MTKSTTTHNNTPRVAALVGPYLSGKTTLLESLLKTAGTVRRKGMVSSGTSVGDGAPEARKRQMSTELNVASTTYLDEKWTLLDCPGSIELLQESLGTLAVADAAVVVCEADLDKAVTVGPLLKFLDHNNIPHIVFINKMDHPGAGVKATLETLQAFSARPLVLREIPIRDGEAVTGHVDLVSERAFQWHDGKSSELVEIPETIAPREQGARDEMLETLADFDDTLLEELLEDTAPSRDEIYDNLKRDLASDAVVPVFFGSAECDHGITRLWKALRHEVPDVTHTAKRVGVKAGAGLLAQAFKTLHAGHAGKLSIARVWSGTLKDGEELAQGRVSGVFSLLGQNHDKVARAEAGEVVALGRLDDVQTGDVLGSGTGAVWPASLPALYSMAIEIEGHADDVKLSAALAKLADEDPSLRIEHDQMGNQLVLWGQGEMHLRIALDKLQGRYGLDVQARRPQVPYRETISKPGSKHARHKKQSGGHGEFGDVVIDIRPQPRGKGFAFDDKIHGGSIPKQYIPAVESGVKEYMGRGPLGFPVVDVAVTLKDGQFHSVDSSDMAFKKAAMRAMREAMPDCQPVLLEPICQVTVSVPNAFTSNAQRIISSRRGKILGFQPKEDWLGWDEITTHMPQSEMHDLIIDLRSQTLGVGTFSFAFDHLQELTGRMAETVLAAGASSGT